MSPHIVLVNLIATPMQLYIFLELIRPEFQKKECYKCAFWPVMILTTLLMGISPVFSIWALNIVTMISSFYIILMLLFDGNIIKKTIYIAMTYALFAMIESLAVSALTVFGGMSIDEITGGISTWLFCAAASDIMGLIIVKLWTSFFGRNRHEANNKYFFLTLLFPVLTAFIFAEFLKLSPDMTVADYRRTSILSVLLFVADAILFYYVEHMMVLMQEQNEYALLRQKNEMEEKYYRKMEEVNREQAVYRHDMKHYQEAIAGLIQAEDIAGLLKISGEMGEALNHVEKIRYTSSGILNALIWEKKEHAAETGIIVNQQIEPGMDVSFIKDTDLITMTGNLIDNAIEAAQRCKDKSIEISMFETDGHFIMFQVINHFDKAPVREDGIFKTTKQNPKMHGMGIESVRRTAEIYGGILDIDMEEDVFKATLALAIGLHE